MFAGIIIKTDFFKYNILDFKYNQSKNWSGIGEKLFVIQSAVLVFALSIFC